MQTLKVDLPDVAATRLRREAARRNTTAEAFAATLLSERLDSDFDVDENELAVIQEAVDEVRAERETTR